ncbi:MAG: hemerythrin family protein [Planctomycetes bacterium]|nr:hemerythrin family protein [Planctomycetota bacterium]
MPTIAWADDLAIDDSQIDFQHRQLIDTMGDLEDALAAGDRVRVAETMPFLRLYAQVHFADEERALELIAWPQLAEHREMHRGFGRRLDELDGAVRRGDLAAGTTLLGFLAAWLAGHIRGADRAFADDVRRLRLRH